MTIGCIECKQPKLIGQEEILSRLGFTVTMIADTINKRINQEQEIYKDTTVNKIDRKS